MQNDIFKLEQAKVLVIGDIMLDAYYEGDANRISPEAPVPVVKIEKKRNLLGGAGNVARNISSLGADCTILSVVGNDYHAQTIKNLLKNEHVNFELIQDRQRPTTVKSRIFARNQQIIRYDEEMIKPVSKTIRAALKHNLEKYLEQHNAVILSDYGKGLLYQNLIEDIYETAKKMKCAAPKIFIDPKPQNKSFYKNAFLLTPNAKETQELAGVCMKTSKEIKKTAKMLLKELKAENLLITLGAEGMVYFSKKEKQGYHIKSSAKQVFDVTGAGDTVIAAMAVCEAVGLEKEKACNIATLAAGLVVEKVGSATVTQEELIQRALTTKIQTEIW